jgi:excisionase family DNA binding protein
MLDQHEVGGASQKVALHAGLPRLLNKRQLAAQLGVGLRTVEELMSARRIPVIRLSRQLLRFDLTRVVTALEKFEVKPLGARPKGATR